MKLKEVLVANKTVIGYAEVRRLLNQKVISVDGAALEDEDFELDHDSKIKIGALCLFYDAVTHNLIEITPEDEAFFDIISDPCEEAMRL